MVRELEVMDTQRNVHPLRETEPIIHDSVSISVGRMVMIAALVRFNN